MIILYLKLIWSKFSSKLLKMKTGLLVKTDFFSDVIFKTSNLKLNSNISMGEKKGFFFLEKKEKYFFFIL